MDTSNNNVGNKMYFNNLRQSYMNEIERRETNYNNIGFPGSALASPQVKQGYVDTLPD